MATSAVAEAIAAWPADVPSAMSDDGSTTRGRSPARRRRVPLRRMSPDQETFDCAVLMEREREFEQQFLTGRCWRPRTTRKSPDGPRCSSPITPAPASSVTSPVAGSAASPRRSALRHRGDGQRPDRDRPFGTSKNLVAQLLDEGGLSADLCRTIWDTLLAPAWPELGEGIEHLVSYQRIDLFAVPFHIAASDPDGPDAMPLAARVASPRRQPHRLPYPGPTPLRRQCTSVDDDLAAVVIEDGIKRRDRRHWLGHGSRAHCR